MKIGVFKVLGLLGLICLLPSCTQTELASHYAKKAYKKQQGVQGQYKVGNPYKVAGKTYVPVERFKHSETGIASWYGPGFNGKKTANGEIYDQYALTAAHKTLQMPSLVRVTNLENGRSVVVRINDRGPFKPGRVIDMSERGAELLGFKNNGTARVRLDVLENESRQIASAAQAGQDTSRFDVASLNRPVRAYASNRRAEKPAPAVLLNDAEALPESLQPEVLKRKETVTVTTTEPLDLSTQPIEVAQLDDITPQKVVRKTVTHAVAQPSNLYVQAGAFSDYRNAERLASNLSDVGVVNISPVDLADAKLYRVRIGPIESAGDADMVLAQVVNSGQADARIIVD